MDPSGNAIIFLFQISYPIKHEKKNFHNRLSANNPINYSADFIVFDLLSKAFFSC